MTLSVFSSFISSVYINKLIHDMIKKNFFKMYHCKIQCCGFVTLIGEFLHKSHRVWRQLLFVKL